MWRKRKKKEKRRRKKSYPERRPISVKPSHNPRVRLLPSEIVDAALSPRNPKDPKREKLKKKKKKEPRKRRKDHLQLVAVVPSVLP